MFFNLQYEFPEKSGSEKKGVFQFVFLFALISLNSLY